MAKTCSKIRFSKHHSQQQRLTIISAILTETTSSKLQELKPKDITEYYNFLKAQTQLSPTTIKHHHQNISKALSDAVVQGYIAVNPSTAARTPKEKRYQAEFLNNTQVERLIELFECTPVYVPVMLCAIYGFRRSEVLGLKWRNIDFEKGTIHICETLQQSTKALTGDSNYTDDTKTDSSNRTLPITSKARELLIRQKKSRPRTRSSLGLDTLKPTMFALLATVRK